MYLAKHPSIHGKKGINGHSNLREHMRSLHKNIKFLIKT